MMDERENEAFDPRAVFEEYERALRQTSGYSR